MRAPLGSLGFLVCAAGCGADDPDRAPRPEPHAEIRHLNPEALNRNPAFTNVITVSGPVKTVYIGGQDSVDAGGNVVGKGDFTRQTEQALKNVQAALKAAGAEFRHVVKWNVYIVQGQSLQAGFEAFQRAWGHQPNPPTTSVMFVAGLAHPDFLVEVDAVAVVPQ